MKKLAETPTVTDQLVKAVVEGNNQFALDLYAALSSQGGNLFFSPYSLSIALAMTYGGARCQTAEQIAGVLHFPADEQKLHPTFAVLIGRFLDEGKSAGYQLHVANALWGQKNYGFLTSYLKLTEDCYGAGLQEVDFATATEEARQTINAWVEIQTQNKIKELLKPVHVDSLTTLILTNAIYFKGDWAVQFEKAQTRDAPFLSVADQRFTVPMMHHTGQFKYLEEDGFQALELSYVGEELSMVVFLPRKVAGLAAFESTLTVDNLSKWLHQLRRQRIIVDLPKFQVTAGCELRKTLSKLGMPVAFTSEADFSGITGDKPLFISNVIHKAFVDVNEEGTEAAAATAVIMTRGLSAAKPPVFRADHPFVFLIRDNRSGSILFLGRLTNPQN